MKSTNVSKIREFRRVLRHLERLVTANVKDNSVCCGVSPTQCHVLLKVEEAGEISLTRLRDYLGLDKSSLSRTVDGLVRLSLLERGEASADRRYSSISLTERGEKFLERLNDECDRYYRPILEEISEERRKRIVEDFEELFHAFSRTVDRPVERSCCSVADVVQTETEDTREASDE